MFKETIKKIPVLGKLALAFYRKFVVNPGFRDSASYWEERYRKGGDSGVGSYHRFAEFKAAVINGLVSEETIQTVIEFGCGDGNQLSYLSLPSYTGYDVSPTAVARCRSLFKDDPTKRFGTMSSYQNEKADLVLSLDVLYHLVEDAVFDSYMKTLFSAADKYVLIYSNNTDDNAYPSKASHVKNRRFTDWIRDHVPQFRLVKHIPNPYAPGQNGPVVCYTDFYLYEKQNETPSQTTG